VNDLQDHFNRLATDGYLGNPTGEDAYAYLRASSERQVEEGSSFSRQIENIHKAAKRDGIRVPFELVFFDDGFTGFEFEHRPTLLRLRHEVKSKSRARHLVIEDIDRLSRNADWQQGYLLEEFARRSIQVHFYINPGTQLERYVRGYIAQEGMQKDLERMRMGNIHKALDGKVTARKRKYGYLKTHPKNTYYVLHPEESKVMRGIYERLIYDGWTLSRIADDLNSRGVPTYFKAGFWNPSTIYQLVRSSVYKGEFYSHKNHLVKTGEFDKNGRPKRTNITRPESEWIKTDVPAVVTPEEWQLAQEALERNAKRSSRNAKKRNWLLAGYLKCKLCHDYAFSALGDGGRKNSRKRYYRCGSSTSYKARATGKACYSPVAHADELERRVWEEIEAVIYDPGIILRRLEEQQQEERRMGYQEQLGFIDEQLASFAKERAKLEDAYYRDIYSLDEFEEKMKDLRERGRVLAVSQAKLQAKTREAHSIEEQKQAVIAALERVREEVDRAKAAKTQPQEIPFDLKRKILAFLVDVIYVDTQHRTFTIEGEVDGTYGLDAPDGSVPSSLDPDGGIGLVSSLKWR
jgi:site-specific DNA recombinase